ncbi:MAG: diacylglycerol kinase [Candidatus Omnitrophota bacterium]
MKKQNIIQSFNSAIEGVIYVVKTQRNMRLHFLLAIIALLSGFHFGLEKTEILLLLITICFVLIAEMMNTAIEINTGLISDSYNPLVRIIKDIAAGCVLVASLNAFFVGYLLFFSRFSYVHIEDTIDKIKSSPWHFTLIILLIVLFTVIFGKVLFHRGTPLRGGMPSGHSALAFSIWAIVALFTGHLVVIILTFILAVLVARSRLYKGIHTFWEVIAGSILGSWVPLLIFQILG